MITRIASKISLTAMAISFLFLSLTQIVAAGSPAARPPLIFYDVKLATADHPESCTFWAAMDTDTAKFISMSPSEKFSAKACAYLIARRRNESQADYEARTSYQEGMELVQWSETSPDDPIFVPESKK